jgi:hypothetical protein
MNPGLNRYDSTRTASFYEQVIERLQGVPGVRAVTLSNPPLLSGSVNGTSFVVQGRPFVRGQQNDVNRVRVAANFFDTMGIPLLAGRAFTVGDNFAAPRVAVINEAAVRKFFPSESPLGRRFGSTPETSSQIEVVGVVRDAKYNSVREDAPATMYVPYTQGPVGGMAFEVRTASDPASTVGAIREAVRQADPNVPLMNVSTQMEQIEARFSQERLFAQAYALFGGLALLVAAVGLFGVMSYSVARRVNEIGLRMALGAQRPTSSMIMRESIVLVGVRPSWVSGRPSRVAGWSPRFFGLQRLTPSRSPLRCGLLAVSRLPATSPHAGRPRRSYGGAQGGAVIRRWSLRSPGSFEVRRADERQRRTSNGGEAGSNRAIIRRSVETCVRVSLRQPGDSRLRPGGVRAPGRRFRATSSRSLATSGSGSRPPRPPPSCRPFVTTFASTTSRRRCRACPADRWPRPADFHVVQRCRQWRLAGTFSKSPPSSMPAHGSRAVVRPR